MNKTIDMMAQLLEKNNIPIPKGTGKKDGNLGSHNKERFHALVDGSSDSSTFIIDSRALRHMASVRDFFTSMYSDSGTTVLMGDDSDIHAKGVGRIDLEDDYFNNVLFVPECEANLLSLY